ncbi:MAG: DUF3592 domain-containing protein [Opitutaceae bacterium]
MWSIVFIAAGVALLIYGIGIVRDARACANWPRVEGRIVSAEPEIVSREKNKTTYAPSVAYTFSVGGREFKGSRVTLVPRNTISLPAVQAMLAPYPVGGTVTVFHDPREPANCVLSTATNGTEWAYAIGGALFIGVGLLMWKQN